MTEIITLLVVIPLFFVVAGFWGRIVVAVCQRFGFHGFRLRLEPRAPGERPSSIRDAFRACLFPGNAGFGVRGELERQGADFSPRPEGDAGSGRAAPPGRDGSG